MLNFKDNFFFFKFSVLFFVLLIFGYWGIDLNSEEVYISFSFLLLVVFGFLLSRSAILYFFTKSLNKKYSRQLSSYLYIVGYLDLELSLFSTVISDIDFLIDVLFFFSYTYLSVLNNLPSFLRAVLFRYTSLVNLNLVFGLFFFFSEKSKLRRFFNFKQKAARIFRFSSLA